MAYFDIPLDLPHAGRLADRILNLLERHIEENGLHAGAMLEAAEGLSSFLFPYFADDDNPPGAEVIRDEAAALARTLVDEMDRVEIRGDRIGQYIRNLFECLELGEEGAEISLRAGENPNSLQRPI
jgi:hypothetical protein